MNIQLQFVLLNKIKLDALNNYYIKFFIHILFQTLYQRYIFTIIELM